MKFVTNKISTGPSKVSFADFAAKVTAKNQAEPLTKVASIQKEAELPQFIKDKIEEKKNKEEGKDSKNEDKKEDHKEESCSASIEEKEVKIADKVVVTEKVAEKVETLAAVVTPVAEKVAEVKVEDKKEVVANSNSQFVKVANLTSKQKEFLKTYYKMIWPETYANALVADK